MSTAICTAACAGALAGARLQQEELALLDGELEVLDVAVVLLEARGDLAQLAVDRGMSFSSSAIGCGVRMPATTSSPWALIRYSP